MRNRAKCKLCNKIIESFTLNDFVHCECGQIGISGGAYRLDCFAQNWENFLRIDDQDNEIEVKIMNGKKKTHQIRMLSSSMSHSLKRN
jgi:hypothetical protein